MVVHRAAISIPEIQAMHGTTGLKTPIVPRNRRRRLPPPPKRREKVILWR